jgi:hypothetical protein
MSSEWEIARVTGRCAVTGRELGEGESYYAVLMETPAGLERRDYSIEGWPGAREGTFCHWKGKIPVKHKRQGPVSLDPELLTHLFMQLEESQSEPMQQLRFVIGLLLMRKRRIRMEQAIQEDGREFWQLRLLQDGSLHRVPNPQLSNEQVDRLGAQLMALLSGEIDAVNFMEGTGEVATSETSPAENVSSNRTEPESERQENLATP